MTAMPLMAGGCPRSPPEPMSSGSTGSSRRRLKSLAIPSPSLMRSPRPPGPARSGGGGGGGGAGLIGGVMVGLTAAKAVALAHELPLIPVNHLEGHALSVRMSEEAAFPYLLLLISGGHTQLIEVSGVGAYRRLGTTIDDAAGEAFDKSAKLLGLGQPGGPMIEAAAKGGRTGRFTFPKPLARREGCDFSLSGLKTALRLEAEAIERPTAGDVADLAAAFQAAIAEHLADRTARAMGRVEQGENV